MIQLIRYAIGFGIALNVTITECTFQHSKVCTVVAVYVIVVRLSKSA